MPILKQSTAESQRQEESAFCGYLSSPERRRRGTL